MTRRDALLILAWIGGLLVFMELNLATRIAEGAPEALGQWRPVASAIDNAWPPSRGPSTDSAVAPANRGEKRVGGGDAARTVATIRARPAAAASSRTGVCSLLSGARWRRRKACHPPSPATVTKTDALARSTRP